LSYSLKDFDYHLPEELIAQKPAAPRDHARLLVYNRDRKTISDDYFYSLDSYLASATTLVVNNSKVEKCRLLFDDGRIEIFVVNSVNDRKVEALVRPGKKFKEGKVVELGNNIRATVEKISDDGIRTLTLSHSPGDELLEPYRYTPFPPYIRQDESLSEEYQTIFADAPGSKAAPTAGLHFTPELIKNLKSRGFGWEEVTLHVGLGTFAPVKAEHIEDHVMHSEWYQIDSDTAEELSRAEHLTAVGTTSVRVLESVIQDHGRFKPCSGETDIFIKPGFLFKAAGSLITNFHLPKSTLLMLVAAFMGFEEMHRVYRHAIKQKYRFYSFGDAMLIL
jgi:S-adenosylmethionine:tRNA ribosyltransferase-isomerase